MMTQNEQRKNRPLTMPVLGIGGVESAGDAVGEAMKPLASDVQSADETVAALTAFLAPYRDG